MSASLLAADGPGRVEHLAGLKFLSVARSHVGHVRTLNEDACLNRPDAGLWAVADGMGGHERGDVASTRIVDALATVKSFGSAYAFRDNVNRTMGEVSAALFAESENGTMGSTVVALLAHRGHFACLWAGDSRAYLYRNGVLRRLTRDHSMVQEMVDAGALSPAEAAVHPKANIITRAVGVQPTISLDAECGAILPGDRFLLCSDGLSGSVGDRSISEIVRRAPLEWAAQSLVDQALAAGGRDNISVVLIAAEASG